LVVPDARSNSLLIRSGDASRLGRLRKFVAMLDSPTNAGGNIHVVYLKNAEAVKLAETLRAIYQNDTVAAVVPRSAMATPAALGASAPAGSPVPMQSTGGPVPLGASTNQAAAASAPAGIIQADAS